MKKLLLLLFLVSCTFSFAQQSSTKNKTIKTIEKVTSSPNPFTNATHISFRSNKAQKVILTVKNLLGKVVFEQVLTSKKGMNSIPFYRNNLVAGIYLYSIQTNEEIITKRLVVK